MEKKPSPISFSSRTGTGIEALFGRSRSDHGRENKTRRFQRRAALPSSSKEIALQLRAVLVQ